MVKQAIQQKNYPMAGGSSHKKSGKTAFTALCSKAPFQKLLSSALRHKKSITLEEACEHLSPGRGNEKGSASRAQNTTVSAYGPIPRCVPAKTGSFRTGRQ